MKDHSIYLDDILDSIEKIEAYTDGISEDEFQDDTEKQDAVFRRLEIIGEAVKHLPDDIRDRHDHIPWRDIAGMRDILIHEYSGVELQRIWNVIQDDLPELKANIEQLKNDI